LKKAIPRLKLKTRDEKKLEKEIDDINNGSLSSFRRDYNQLEPKYQEISKKLKDEGLLEKLEAIQNDISQVQREISEIEQKYSRVKDNYERNLIKIRDARTYIEKVIQSTIKEEIKINF
jgi:predicted nuclease with TOPRIM domain